MSSVIINKHLMEKAALIILGQTIKTIKITSATSIQDLLTQAYNQMSSDSMAVMVSSAAPEVGVYFIYRYRNLYGSALFHNHQGKVKYYIRNNSETWTSQNII